MILTYLGADDSFVLEKDDRSIAAFPLPHSLISFMRRTPSLKDSNFLILDLRGGDFSTEHILSSIQSLNQFSGAKPIVICDAGEETDLLFPHLQNMQVQNLIAYKEGLDITQKLEDCIAGRRDISDLSSVRLAGLRQQGLVDHKLHIPDDLRIKIAILGALPRIGATSHAIGLYQYMKSLGFAPLIIDRSDTVALHLQYDKDNCNPGRFLEIHSVDFDMNENITSNAQIFDLGAKLTDEVFVDIMAADITVVVSGTKVAEVLALAGILPRLNALETSNLFHILSFSDERAVEELAKNLNGRCIAAPYQPNIWKGNNDFYSSFLFDTIKGLCHGN